MTIRETLYNKVRPLIRVGTLTNPQTGKDESTVLLGSTFLRPVGRDAETQAESLRQWMLMLMIDAWEDGQRTGSAGAVAGMVPTVASGAANLSAGWTVWKRTTLSDIIVLACDTAWVWRKKEMLAFKMYGYPAYLIEEFRTNWWIDLTETQDGVAAKDGVLKAMEADHG